MEALLAFAITLTIAMLISARAEQTVLSTAVLFLAAGILLGNGVFQVIHLDPTGPAVSNVAEVALFGVLFTDGMRVPIKHWRSKTRLGRRALFYGMPLTIVAIAVVARLLVGFGWPESFLIAAILSPTDPVFASALFRFSEVPRRLQTLLNVESGLNDGLALPVIIYLLGRLGKPEAHPFKSIEEMGVGLLVGFAIPFFVLSVKKFPLFNASERYRPIGGVSIALLVYSICEMIHGNLFFAAFAAGITTRWRDEELADSFEPFGEFLAELLKLGALLLFGSLLTGKVFDQFDFGIAIFVLAVLFVARPAALAIALFGSDLSRREWLAAAWFGPKGFASVVYGLLVFRAGFQNSTHIAHVVALVIVASIVAHSSTDVIVARWFKGGDSGQGEGKPDQSAPPGRVA